MIDAPAEAYMIGLGAVLITWGLFAIRDAIRELTDWFKEGKE